MLTVQKTLLNLGRLTVKNQIGASTTYSVARYSSKKKSKDPAENNEHLYGKLSAKLDPSFIQFEDEKNMVGDFSEDIAQDLLKQYEEDKRGLEDELGYDDDQEIEDFRRLDDFDQYDAPDDEPIDKSRTKKKQLLYGDEDFEDSLEGLDENDEGYDEEAFDRQMNELDEDSDNPVEMDDFYNNEETNQYFEQESALHDEAVEEDEEGGSNLRFSNLMNEFDAEESGEEETEAAETQYDYDQLRKYRDLIGPIARTPESRAVRSLYDQYRVALDDPRPLDPIIKQNIYDAYMEDPVYYNPYQLSKIYHIHPNRIAAIIRFQQIYLKEVEAGEEVFDDLELAMCGFFGTREQDENVGQFEPDLRKMERYWLLNGKDNIFDSINPKRGKRIDPIHERPENIPKPFPEKPVYFRGPTLEKPKRKNLIFIDKSRDPFTGRAQTDPLILISAIDGSLRTPSSQEREKILEKHRNSKKDLSPHALLKLPLNYKDHDAYHKGKKNKVEEESTEEQL